MKPGVFSGTVASVVAEVGSLFLRLRALIAKVDKSAQNCSESSICKRLSVSERFWKMGSAKCARDSSESSTGTRNRKSTCQSQSALGR